GATERLSFRNRVRGAGNGARCPALASEQRQRGRYRPAARHPGGWIMTQPTTGVRTAASDSACEVPFISVIVPVRHEASHVAHTLERLFAQDFPTDRFEVLVADGRSTDETRTIVTALTHRFANLRLLDNPNQWSSAGRNVAAKAARGDVILLVDGHCEIGNV